jgi:hypothetical protein
MKAATVLELWKRSDAGRPEFVEEEHALRARSPQGLAHAAAREYSGPEGAAMAKEVNSIRGRLTRWRQWRERRKRTARERRAWAEERLNRENEERYRAWGRGVAASDQM